ncbi:MAG: DUF4340 domain-containing protein [Chitinophagaceae bacterium]|nr:DUF4340 domain-containing protein [Chitinophagaceae bacterium]
MKKNLLYLAALLVLLVLTYYFVFREDNEAYSKSEANFTVEDTAAVKTIFLSNLRNENIKLNRTPAGWTLNDTLRPRPDAINALLRVMTLQQPEQPVTTSYHDNVVKDMSVNNTKVEIYTAKGKTHTFYVGKNPGPNNETYMLNENAKRPFVVKLPLQNTFAGVLYFNSVSEWRNKRIFEGATPVETVEVVYKDSVQYSYKLDNTGLRAVLTGNRQIATPLNYKRISDYLKLLDNLFCTGFEDTYIYKDSIIKSGRQLATVFIKRKEVPAQQMTFYFTPVSQGTKKAINIGGKEYDYDQFFGLLNQKDFVQLSRKTTEKILRSYPEFYQMNAD